MDIYEPPVTAGRARRPLVWACLCFAAGIALNESARLPFPALFAAAAALLLLRFFPLHKWVPGSCLLLTLVLAGAMHSQSYQAFPEHHISRISYGYRKQPVLVEGVVVSDVEKRPFFKGKKTVFTLKVDRVHSPWGWKKKSGDILVNLFREEKINYGDHLLLEGKLHRPFAFSNDSNFSYPDYLYRHGITFILSVKKDGRVETLARRQGNVLADLSLRFKHRLSGVLREHLPPGQAGIMQAFLLGDRYDIPKNVYDLFKLSGVAHIIAISGFNIGIVAYAIFLVLKVFPVPRTGQYLLTIVFLVFYAFLAGGQPPVVRATIMAAVFLLGFVFEREPDSINSLSAAGMLILVFNPLNLFDVGFQLSFASVLSIIILYPRFMALFGKWLPGLGLEAGKNGEEQAPGRMVRPHSRALKFLLQSVAVSLAAYLGIIPLIVHYFQLITPAVIIANLIVVPLASLIIFLGMGLLAAGVLLPVIAFAFANCVSVLLNLMVASVFLISMVPGAYFELKEFPLWAGAVYYSAMVLGINGMALWEGRIRAQNPDRTILSPKLTKRTN